MNTIPSVVNNNVSFGNNAKGVQIQQGTVSSTQSLAINQEFDYEKSSKILHEIQHYMGLPAFETTFKDNTDNAKHIINQALEMVGKKEDPLNIQKCLGLLKDLTVNTGGSLISSGIIALLSQILKS